MGLLPVVLIMYFVTFNYAATANFIPIAECELQFSLIC
jgi:hypothetical protein